MFCPHCHNKIPDGSNICPLCYSNLAGLKPQKAAAEPQDAPERKAAPKKSSKKKTQAYTKGSRGGKKSADRTPMIIAFGLIMILVGIVIPVVAMLPERKPTDVRTLSMAALFAALCYIGFSYCKIDIPVGMEKTAFHLGNVFCVLAALFLGGFWGGMSGAVGMTIADLTTAYVTSAPKTFLLKLCIGLITGLVAHRIGKITKTDDTKHVFRYTLLSAIAGLLFNVIFDPLVGYYYKLLILGRPAAELTLAWNITATTINAVTSTIVAVALYMVLRPAMKKSGLFPKVK